MSMTVPGVNRDYQENPTEMIDYKQLCDKVNQSYPISNSIYYSFSLNVQLLGENAKLPQRQNPGDAGYDLFSPAACVVKAKSKLLIPLDIAVMIPQGYYGQIAPRSSLASKKFIDVGAGIVDSGYRGNLGVLLFNFSDEDFHVSVGDRIAQLILIQIATPDVRQVDHISGTTRGTGGFGSTGQ